MASKIDKKGDHEPNKYFEGEAVLTAQEKITEQKLLDPQKLNESDIENLTSKFLMNKIYYKMAKRKKREEALKIAAGVVLGKGQKIKNQLEVNDEQIKKTNQKNPQNDQKNLAAQNQNQNQNAASQSANPKGGKADIPKISGGTLSEVIAKITEMMAGKSGAAFKTGADNFAAMVEVLAAPEVQIKFDETMKYLAKDPVLVVGIQDVLQNTSAANIFAQAVEKNFSAAQKQAISTVSFADLQARNFENFQEQSIGKMR
ncbi:MAG: hypothetical protein V4612_02745 [Pseudomonadota bacterium]